MRTSPSDGNPSQASRGARAGLPEIQRVLKRGANVALGCTVNSGEPKDGIAKSLAAAGFAQARSGHVEAL